MFNHMPKVKFSWKYDYRQAYVPVFASKPRRPTICVNAVLPRQGKRSDFRPVRSSPYWFVFDGNSRPKSDDRKSKSVDEVSFCEIIGKYEYRPATLGPVVVKALHNASRDIAWELLKNSERKRERKNWMWLSWIPYFPRRIYVLVIKLWCRLGIYLAPIIAVFTVAAIKAAV